MSGKIVRTANITQSAIGNKDGLWTTVFAAGVFINDDNPSVEAGKSVVNNKASLQQEILSQSLQGQLKNVDAGDRLILRNENSPKSGIVPRNSVPSVKKSVS